MVVCAVEMILTGGTLLCCEGEGCHVDDVLLSRDKTLPGNLTLKTGKHEWTHTHTRTHARTHARTDFWIAQYVSFQYLLVCKMSYSAFRII